MKVILLNDLHYGCGGNRGRKIHEAFVSLLSSKISECGVEAIVIAGDTGTSKQDDLEKFFKLLRASISIPVLLVFGNHDYWDGKPPFPLKFPRLYHEIRTLHEDLCKRYDLHYLENGPFKLRNIQFSGYDGWYRSVSPGTNDICSSTSVYMREYIESVPTHLYLNSRAHKECERVLSEVDSELVNVCVSHFDSTVTDIKFKSNEDDYDTHRGDHNHLIELSDRFDFIFYGHTHREIDEQISKSRILSSGTDYLHPVGLIVEIPESTDVCDPSKTPVKESFKLPWTKRTF